MGACRLNQNTTWTNSIFNSGYRTDWVINNTSGYCAFWRNHTGTAQRVTAIWLKCCSYWGTPSGVSFSGDGETTWLRYKVYDGTSDAIGSNWAQTDWSADIDWNSNSPTWRRASMATGAGTVISAGGYAYIYVSCWDSLSTRVIRTSGTVYTSNQTTYDDSTDRFQIAYEEADHYVWIYNNGWKKAIPYVYSSEWKKTTPYIYNNGWKIGATG